MGSKATNDFDHAGFTRTIDRADGPRHIRMSFAVVATLAIAIMASAAAITLDDNDHPGGHSSQAAWNISHGTALPTGG